MLTEKTSQPRVQPKAELLETKAAFKDGQYRFVLNRTIMGRYKYVNFSTVERTRATAKAQ